MSGTGPGRTDGDATDDSESGPLGRWAGRVELLVVLLVVALVALYAAGVIGPPSAGVADRGDWGTVTEERTEIVTTVWVDNPNPIRVVFGDSLRVEYDIAMNGVVLAEGDKSNVTIPKGNTTKRLRTDLLNDRLAEWWVEFVRADETIDLRVDATLTVSALATVTQEVSVERTMLDESTPVRDALSASANSTAGTYTQSVSTDQLDSSLTDVDAGGDGTVTVGYEVRRGWATWGPVSEEETVVRFHLLVHNPGDVPVPAAPDGVGVAVDANDVRLLEAEGDEFSLRGVGPDAVIQPGETREVVVAVRMDNAKVDDWFTSHVREDRGPGVEGTAVSTQFQVVFESPATGTTFRLPRDSPATYDCEFRTAILADGQEPSTTCGRVDPPTGPGGAGGTGG